LVGALVILEKLRITPAAGFSVTDWSADVIFIVVLHRALPDLQRMKLLLFCCRVVGTEVGILFGAIKPDL
jgi:hypothetical protein